MKKLLIAVLTLTAVWVLGFSQGEQTEFSVKIIPTKAVNIKDQFAGFLPNRSPVFPLVSRVVCNEPFYVRILFSGAQAGDGARLAGKVVMTDPAGKKTEIPLQSNIQKIRGKPSGIFLMPQSLRIVYEARNPRGKYVFTVEMTDLNANRTAKASAGVEYAEKQEPKPDVKAFGRLQLYYRAPCPEYILPAFREFLAGLPQQKVREKNRFNPLPQLALFYFALRENPQCVPAFAELFRNLQNEEKMLAAVVLNFVLADAAKVLTTEQRSMVLQRFPQNPFVFDTASRPWHLDVCWAEFFIHGTKAPVMKVVNAMSLIRDSMTVADYKKIAHPSAEDRRKLVNGLTAMAAHWSFGSLAKTHPLIRFYTEAALVRGEVRDPVAAALAAKAIGLKVQIRKGTENRK